MIPFGYQLFAVATLLTHIFMVILIATWFLQKRSKKELALTKIFKTYCYSLVFASTFIATMGSLFFSEIAKFQPCILCWYQRIAMYPQALLSYIGLMRGESNLLKPYLIALNIVGVIISLYHNFLLWFPKYAELVECSTKGGPSCIKGYTFYFGYITIPLMALTVFTFNILIMMLFSKKK